MRCGPGITRYKILFAKNVNVFCKIGQALDSVALLVNTLITPQHSGRMTSHVKPLLLRADVRSMGCQIYQMYASFAGTTDAAAAIDIRNDGTIERVQYDIVGDGVAADGAGGGFQLAFGSTSKHTTNDDTSVITGAYFETSMQTSGAFVGGKAGVVEMNCPVQAGERLYLHGLESGTTTAIIVRLWIHVNERGGHRPRSRRA